MRAMETSQALEPPPVLALPAPRPIALWQHASMIVLAVAGCALGIVGAFAEEMRSTALLPAIFAAPVIEEALKPSGLYILLLRWPHLLRTRLQTALLAGLAGLCFGLVESALYLEVYVPDHAAWYTVYRLSVTLVLHATASFIVGFGLGRGLIDWAAGRGSFPLITRNCFIAAVCLHALFNLTVTILSILGYMHVN